MPTARKKRVHFNAFVVSAFARMHHWSLRPRGASDVHVTDLVAEELFDEGWLYCIDEFPISDVATATVLRQVLQHLICDLGAVVVCTSNRAISELHKGGIHQERHSPFIDLLNDRLESLHLRSKTDHRVQMLREDELLGKSNKSYFLLENDAEAKAFSARIAQLFDGAHLYGRQMTLQQAAHGKALLTFEELCGTHAQAFGPADYLILCQRYHTIVVKGIPRMGLEEKNEARRFITFVDAAYENKVKLIISAFAGRDDLFVITDPAAADMESSEAIAGTPFVGNRFTGEEERFAFRRAVSRLKEMSTEGWNSARHVPTQVDFGSVKHGSHVTRGSQGKVDAVANLIATRQQRPITIDSARAVERERVQPSSDDFGDEASYRGYLRQYQRFQQNEDTTNEVTPQKRARPQFPERHFWGMGLWGKRAGVWGMGVRAVWEGASKKARERASAADGKGKGFQKDLEAADGQEKE
ncbi:hypothetical protein HDU86_002434 [Geranomyces michiganensis]|nr:hypothetical protein HDU86_002434 [Geranomyces michiganensis]